MGRTICRPRIRIDPVFLGERNLVDAYGEAYARFFDLKENHLLPAHTLVRNELITYTSDEFTKGEIINETAD